MSVVMTSEPLPQTGYLVSPAWLLAGDQVVTLAGELGTVVQVVGYRAETAVYVAVRSRIGQVGDYYRHDAGVVPWVNASRSTFERIRSQWDRVPTHADDIPCPYYNSEPF